MKVCVILYQDLRLTTCKVSQKGYKTLFEAQGFCRARLGLDDLPDNPALYSRGDDGGWVFGNSATKQQYTIVEVTV